MTSYMNARVPWHTLHTRNKHGGRIAAPRFFQNDFKNGVATPRRHFTAPSWLASSLGPYFFIFKQNIYHKCCILGRNKFIFVQTFPNWIKTQRVWETTFKLVGKSDTFLFGYLCISSFNQRTRLVDLKFVTMIFNFVEFLWSGQKKSTSKSN